MKKIIFIIAILVLVLGSAFKPLNPPIRYPTSLDELYSFIENKEPGWVFTECNLPLPNPYFTWGQVKLINNYAIDDNGNQELIINSFDISNIAKIGGIDFTDRGILKISENKIFALLIYTGLSGNILLCSINEKPVIYGDGLYWFFNEIEKDVVRGDATS